MSDVTERIRGFWDEDARLYDRSASHGLSDPLEAAVWRATLLRHLPPPGARVLDVGAGTGAMALLAAELGYRVTALDFSSEMLASAREKAAARGLDVEFVVAPAEEPPAGPFEAVMQRHVLWTAPDPVRSLRAWRRAAPGGRLVVFEGLPGPPTPMRRAREALIHTTRRALAIPHDHHGEYDPDVLTALPLAGTASPAPFVQAVAAAGWRRCRVERLRDVEWARRLAAPPPLRWLQGVVQFALVAEDQPGAG